MQQGLCSPRITGKPINHVHGYQWVVESPEYKGQVRENAQNYNFLGNKQQLISHEGRMQLRPQPCIAHFQKNKHIPVRTTHIFTLHIFMKLNNFLGLALNGSASGCGNISIFVCTSSNR